VVSDRASFAWLCDVFVLPAHRGQGVARSLVRALRAHPELQGLRRWLLATRDAHGVYAALGFAPLAQPERWMEINQNAIHAST
jgi:GNAT superfamily N-acetyltransferase